MIKLDPLSESKGMDLNVTPLFSEEDMKEVGVYGNDNLCSLLQEIYLKESSKIVRLWCRLAMAMARNMYRALFVYGEILTKSGVAFPEYNVSSPTKLMRSINMRRNRLFGKTTLCATLRNIYEETKSGEVKLCCRQAVRKAKATYNALQLRKELLRKQGIIVTKQMRDEWEFSLCDFLKEKIE